MDVVKSISPIQNALNVEQPSEPNAVPEPPKTALTVHEDEAFNKNDSEADFSMAAPEQSSRLESLDLNALVQC